ncbi:MAG: biotin biosynthesis protein BioC, partial [Verrucomicrobia bacterium]|nr:biotin biosynthesis protein BioC [Verrucomicrobiota bacterium]
MRFPYDHSSLRPNRAVSNRDSMVWPGAEEQYFQLGERAINLVQLAADLCDKPHLPKILDLPCGYGRVLRWLRAKYPASEITACDLE